MMLDKSYPYLSDFIDIGYNDVLNYLLYNQIYIHEGERFRVYMKRAYSPNIYNYVFVDYVILLFTEVIYPDYSIRTASFKTTVTAGLAEEAFENNKILQVLIDSMIHTLPEPQNILDFRDGNSQLRQELTQVLRTIVQASNILIELDRMERKKEIDNEEV